MKGLRKILLSIAVSGTFALVLTACGGGGGGTTTTTTSTTEEATALKVAERVSVVDAQESSAGKVAPLKIGVLQLASDLPADSAYNTDETFVFVEERSAESFDIINEILCMMGQTGYQEMLNEGTYKAQIDIGQCETGRDSASSAGESSQNQSSGSNTTEYEFWTVNSSRADNDSPHIVTIWIHEKGEDMGGGFVDPAKVIEVKFTITEGVSATNPYGIFVMNFKAHPENDTTIVFSGYMRTERDASGTVLLKFYVDGGMDFDSDGTSDMTFTEKVTLDRASDGSSGSGSTYNGGTDPFEGSSEKTFDIAYNATHFFRSDGTAEVCLSRANPDVTVWRYGLYYNENHDTDAGGRITVDSGFPIKYNDGSKDYFGWVGFYGLWLPDSVSVSDNATIYRQDYGPGGTQETPYTIKTVGGKLRKHTKKTLTLSEITGVPLGWHECTEVDPGNWSCQETRVEWNGTVLVKNAVRSEQTNWVWKNITEDVVTFDTNDWDFNFYSDSLGGNGRINLKDPTDGSQITLSNTTNVVFHIEDTVFPGESGIPTSLVCFENCPEPANINGGSPYFTASTWEAMPNDFNTINQNVAPGDLVAGTNYIAYTFDTATMELKYGGTAAVMTSNTSNQHGIWTGAMFEPTTANLSELACDWDNTKTCTWQTWDKLDVFYTWETGTQQWNRLTILTDADSNVVSFDPPLSVEYTNTNGSKFYLEYNGFGDLHGIPGTCVDMDTGQDVDCWDETGMKFIRWVPEFNIPDGSSVTDAVNSTAYYVKALEKEERMRSVDTTQCTDAGLSLQSYTLPDTSLYEDPDIGDEPTVTDAPAVIGGVLQ